MSHADSLTLRTLFATAATAYALTFASGASAQVTTQLPKQGKTEVQCLYNGAQVAVLYKEGKAPWANSKTFITQKVKALQKKQKKAGKAAAAIKKAVKQLRKRLAQQDKKLLDLCRSQANTVTDPSVSGEGLVSVAKQGGYTLYVYQGKKSVAHSFAFDVTERGAISGTFYKGEPFLDPSSTQTGSGPGLRIFIHGRNPSSPFVWSGKVVKKMCDNCSGLTIGSLNDAQTIALGMKNDGIAGATPAGVLFNYATGSITDVPLVGGKPILAGDINEAGRLTGSVQHADGRYDAAVSFNGTMTELSRSVLIAALDNALRPLVEEDVKRELYENKEFNECSDAQIATTRLIGSHRREREPSTFGIRVTNSDYMLGSIVEGGTSTWDYTGLCESGTHRPFLGAHTFVLKPGNVLQVIPGSAVPFSDSAALRLATGVAINNLGQIAGMGQNDSIQGLQIARINAQRGDLQWGLTSLNSGPFAMITPTDINDKGILVGTYSPNITSQGMRACLVTNDNTLVDLGDFMGIKRDSGLVLVSATAINNCNTIVGNSWDEKTKQNHLFVLAPDGCPIPS
jgi:hypothetical protein